MMHYLIQANVLLLLLFTIYMLLLRNSRLLVFNRFYLLFSLCLSLIIPIAPLNFVVPDNHFMTSYLEVSNYAQQLSFNESKELAIGPLKAQDLSVAHLLLMAYVFMTLFFFIRFVANLTHLLILTKNKGPVVQGMQTVYINADSNPFSFFNYLFINKLKFTNVLQNKSILWHEKAHCKQKHSIDMLLLGIIQCVFWFNPILIFYKKAIQNNHEFLADDYATTQGNGSNDYLLQLMEFIKQKRKSKALSSGFAYQNIKKRIQVIQQQKPNAMKKTITITLSLSAALTVLSICSFTMKDSALNYTNHALVTKSKKATTPSILPIKKEAITKISSEFGMRMSPFYKTKKMHTGIDIVAPKNTTILATADGIVSYAAYSEGYGKHIKIKHGDTFQTMYAHLEHINVEIGQHVKTGDSIGIIGNTGKSVKTHLHYEVLKDNENVNPADYFQYEIAVK